MIRDLFRYIWYVVRAFLIAIIIIAIGVFARVKYVEDHEWILVDTTPHQLIEVQVFQWKDEGFVHVSVPVRYHLAQEIVYDNKGVVLIEMVQHFDCENQTMTISDVHLFGTDNHDLEIKISSDVKESFVSTVPSKIDNHAPELLPFLFACKMIHIDNSDPMHAPHAI